MAKFLTSCVLVLTLAHASPTFAQQIDEVLFIASEEELKFALNNREKLKGLAVSSEFYTDTTTENQENIAVLSRHVLSLGFRPLFIYGYKIDFEVFRNWIEVNGEFKGEFRCAPKVMVGVFPTIYISRYLADATVVMCGSDDNAKRPEDWFREWISNYWLKTKKELADEGYITLR